MAGSYCYYPVSAPPPAMRGYGWVAETIAALAQVGATVYSIDVTRDLAKQAQHQAARDAAAANQAAAAQQYAQQQAQVAIQQQSGAGGGIQAQLAAVPVWALGAAAVGAAALLWRASR